MLYKKIWCVLLIFCLLVPSGCAESQQSKKQETKETEETEETESSILLDSLSHEGYTLEKVVILSRHNLRAPISDDTLLDKVTPHDWYEWSAPNTQLSVRGGTLEVQMGQYFRKWFESEGLFEENCHPEDGEVRIYANSLQRTIATANFFSTGLMPVAEQDVEYHMDYGVVDPVFSSNLTFCSDEYSEACKAEIDSMFGDDISDLTDNYNLLKDVIDMDESEAVKKGDIKDFYTDDTKIIIKEGAHPGMKGSLKTACKISDALIMQYYEEEDEKKAAFGNELSDDEWAAIAEIKDVYGQALFASTLVAVNAAHPLLEVIDDELLTDERKFSFICGHDQNISSVLGALKAEEYTLCDTIEKKAPPIGCKVVFSRFRNEEGEEFMSVDMVYQTTEQLREMSILDLENDPAIYPLSFEGISRNEDGLFSEQEMMEHLQDVIDEYDELKARYGKAGED